MTREEEIRSNMPSYTDDYEDEQSSLCEEGFIDGARWADEHPSEETIRRVLETFFCRCDEIEDLSASDLLNHEPSVDRVIKLVKERL